MLSTSPLRSDAMKLAWAIRRTGQSFSDSIKKAWASIRVKTQPGGKAVGFHYVKDDGTERYALALNAVAPPRPEQPARPDKPAHPLIVKYYDVLASGWRSFRADRLILN